MSSMIERVARAIDPGAWVMFPEDNYPAEIRRKDARKVAALEQARSALEAMLEPTEQMKEAGDIHVRIGHIATEKYKAMINAALKEE